MAEGIEVGDEMAQFAVRMDQIVNAGGRPIGVARLTRRGGGAGGGAIKAQIKACEEGLPAGVERSRIALILRV